MSKQLELHDSLVDDMDNILRLQGWQVGNEACKKGLSEAQCRQWAERWVLHFVADEEIRKEIKDDVMRGWRYRWVKRGGHGSKVAR